MQHIVVFAKILKVDRNYFICNGNYVYLIMVTKVKSRMPICTICCQVTTVRLKGAKF